MDEPASEILAEQRSGSGSGVPEKNPALFTELMLSRSIESFERMTMTRGPVFFDRGVVDQIGYARLFDIDPAAAERASARYRYAPLAFFLPAWPAIYEQDDERKMTFEQARDFGEDLRSVYRCQGYELREVPCAAVESRAEFVLRALNAL